MAVGTTIKVTVQTASFLKEHWKKLLPVAFFILLLPLLMASSLTVTSSVPAVNEDQVRIYIEAAESAGKGKTVVDWKDLVAIDAVRYKQEFSDVTSSDALSLANKFIKEVKTEKQVTTTNPDTGKEETKTVVETTYTTKSIDEVMDELNFTEEERTYAKTYKDVGMSALYGSDDLGNYGGGTLIDGNGNPTVKLSQTEFFERINKGAIEGYKKYNIFPSITIAQAAIESTWGTSGLVSKANNLFGIKAFYWNGPYVEMPTQEVYGGVTQTVMAKFRAYSSWDESMVDHGKFLADNNIYAKNGVLSAKDYIEQAYALKKAGYATDPQYALKLITLIQQFNLQRYDVK